MYFEDAAFCRLARRAGWKVLYWPEAKIVHLHGGSSGVTEVAARLQEAGLIHCSRGHVAVLDRPRMEARACECYAVVKKEYDRLLPDTIAI